MRNGLTQYFREYLLLAIRRQISLKQIGRFISNCLYLLGAYYSCIKLVELLAKRYPEVWWIKTVNNNIDGEWLEWIMIAIILFSIVCSWKKIKTSYSIKSKDIKIVFDYCEVIAGSGHRVIEISNNFCLDTSKIGRTNDLTYFKDKFDKINSSLKLGDILKKSVKAHGFHTECAGHGKKAATYPLGVFATNDFKGNKYIFVTSIKRGSNDTNVTTDMDFTEFLSNFWMNLSGKDWNNEALRIPVFSGAGKYTLNTKMRIYKIVSTFIKSVKDGNIPCKELHICINNDLENSKDLDSYKGLCQYIDDFMTTTMSGGKRVGNPLELPANSVENR